jgi:TonB-dependent SusC/RagA subfamily outer membrane receptor
MKIIFFVLLVFCFETNCIHAQAKANNAIQGTYRTIFDMLRDVPGLEVKNTNDKTGGSVVIRGVGRLNNQKPPFFVLDGVVYNNDITSINVQDIESISVLKDAASSTAYGAQGASGVILIITKKGNTNQPQAQVNSHDESAYTYFIKQKMPLSVIGWDDKTIVKGIIQEQRDSSLVFLVKKKEMLVPVKKIARVELSQQ